MSAIYWFDSMGVFVADRKSLKLVFGQGTDNSGNVSSGDNIV